jgi:hypothetical protein
VALTGIRTLSWLLGIGAFLAVIINFGNLPDTLPVTRWYDAPKSWHIALRVPAINLCMLGMAAVLSQALLRLPNNSHLWIASMLLHGTAGIKCVTAAVELIALPSRSPFLPVLISVLVVVGLGGSVWVARADLANGKWRLIKMTTLETLIASILIGCILILNLPLVLR